MFLDGLSPLIESFACSVIFLPLLFQNLICFLKSIKSMIFESVSFSFLAEDFLSVPYSFG